MASQVFNIYKALASWAGSDIRAILCMSNTTADTEKDADTISGITTLDESDATGYARVALTGEASNIDDTNDRAEMDANDVVFSGLSGNATRDYQGVLLYRHVTNDTDSVPVVFVEFSSTVTKNATSVTIPWNAEGIIQAT
jgi:hypothetical protein